MKFFNSDNQDLEKAIKASKVGFAFDQNGVKNRLFSNLHSAKFNKPEVFVIPKSHFKRNFALGTCLVAVFCLVGGFTYADSAKPGDALFFLDQFQEQMALKIPRPSESKVKLQSQIINERLQELEQIPETDSGSEIETVRMKAIEETQKELIKAVNDTAAINQNLRQQGKEDSVKNVNTILTELDKIAEQQQLQIENSKDRKYSKDYREKLNRNLEDIKKARLKAREELNRGKTNEINKIDPTTRQDETEEKQENFPAGFSRDPR